MWKSAFGGFLLLLFNGKPKVYKLKGSQNCLDIDKYKVMNYNKQK